jgi:hypothetical protein
MMQKWLWPHLVVVGASELAQGANDRRHAGI